MRSGCVKTPCVPTKQAQKYRPLFRRYENHNRTLSSTQTYQAAPTNAAIVIAIARSFLRSSATPMLEAGLLRRSEDAEQNQKSKCRGLQGRELSGQGLEFSVKFCVKF
jgi:hypothetical protein